MVSEAPILACTNLVKRYGGVHALNGISWQLRAGEVHALCGENGAGKSTLARICCGITMPDGGDLVFAGRRVAWGGADQARRAGLGIILQELDLFAGLTVAENIALGNPRLEPHNWILSRSLEEAVRGLLRDVRLEVEPSTRLGRLSVSQWQLVAIARALAQDARVIFMDEPTSALTEDAVERLFELIGRLKARGVAVVYVSHKMAEIFRISDRISVMRDGAMISTQECGETSIAEVIQLMVGRPVVRRSASEFEPSQAGSLLRVHNLTARRLRNVSFDLSRGEILGVAGLVGSGRSELGRVLFGLSPFSEGRMELNGSNYRPRGVREAVSRGLVLVPEDRRQGLVQGLSVRQNTTLACLPKFARIGWINSKREATAATEALAACRTKRANDDLPVGALSGGNQQKVLLAKWLLNQPRICFFDDPTRGVDIGAKDDFYRLIAELAAAGVGIIWVSSELPELLANAHRITILNEGRCAGMVDAADTTQEEIMGYATGHIT
jgi:ABC-type sugar transport system ATPase subunit